MPDPRVVFVDVSIKSISPLDFDVLPSSKNKPQLPTNPNPKNPGRPEIIFRNDGNDGFVIHFELIGDTHGYFFPAVESEAVWSQRGRACPDETGVWDVFSPLQVVSSGHPSERRTLIVRNLNPNMGGGKGQGKFMYNLRVTNGSRPLNLDPPGDNTNGSSGLYSYSTAETFLVAGAVATAAFAAVTTVGFVDDSNASMGTALLAALTVGFAAAALWERFRRS